MTLKKILFILHLPPPIHGAGLMGKYIYDSFPINETFNSEFINLSTSKTVNEIGKKPILKIVRFFKIFWSTFHSILIFNPDKVYISISANGFGFYKDLILVLIVKLFRKKIVLHYHNKGVSSYQNNFIDNILYKILFNKVKVILLSKYLYYDIEKYVKLINVYFCPNGIPLVQPIQSYSKKNSPIKLLFLSNLIETKGIFVMLDALKLLKDKNIDFHCNIVGGEADISITELNSKLYTLGLNSEVSYLGKQYGDDKYTIYNNSDIFVFPTFYPDECFPLVLLEAMMFGLPVVSTKEGGIQDIVKDNHTGYLVEKESHTKLAKQIEFLIKHPNKVTEMGEYARNQFLEKYTLNIFEERLIEILKCS